MKRGFREYWRAVGADKRARMHLTGILERLALYCQAPDPRAKGSSDLHEAMKQFTHWPQSDLLKQLENCVLTLASTERKNPSWRTWKAFELVDRRTRKLHLLKHINELAERAGKRFTEANFSDLEALEWERRHSKDAQDLLSNIDRIKENVGAAGAIDWAQYKDILARFPGDGHTARASGNDTALACYARVLELIIDHRRWEELRKESEALVFWLLKIGYPKADQLEAFNRRAALWWIFEEEASFQQKRQAKWGKFQQSKRVIKKSKDDIEDDRLMARVSGGKADALKELRKRHEGRVKKVVREITRSNSATDDITQKVFIQVWKAAPTYVPAAKFTTWLTKIAKNLALNEKKRAKKVKDRVEFAHVSETGSKARKKKGFSSWRGEDDPSMEDSEEVSTQGDVAEGDEGDSETDGEKYGALHEALARLSPLEQRVIQGLHGIGGSKRKDSRALAIELGTTASAVEDVASKAESKIREFMSP